MCIVILIGAWFSYFLTPQNEGNEVVTAAMIESEISWLQRWQTRVTALEKHLEAWKHDDTLWEKKAREELHMAKANEVVCLACSP